MLCACRGGKYEQLVYFLTRKPALVKSVDDCDDNVLEICEYYSKDDRLAELLIGKYKIKKYFPDSD